MIRYIPTPLIFVNIYERKYDRRDLLMNKKQVSTIAIYAILLVIFNVIYFAVPFEKSAITWVTYVFTWIAFVLGCGITYYAFRGAETLQSKVYGFPIFRIGFIYTVAQIIVTVIMCVVGAVCNAPAWIAVVVSIVILAAALIGVIAADNTRDVIQEMEQKTVEQTKVVKTFRLDVASLVGKCKDSVAKKKMEDLADAFKYSDPVSNDELAEVEKKITYEVEELKRLVLGNDVEALIGKIDEVQMLLADRNRRCKEGK